MSKLPTPRRIVIGASAHASLSALLRARRPDLEIRGSVYTNVTARADGRARATIDDPNVRRRTVIEFDPRSLSECVVFTPPAPRRAICVEPQSCPTDAFNLAARGVEAHVVALAPGAEARWSIVIRSEPTS